MAIIALAYYGVQQRALFSESAAHLNKTLANYQYFVIIDQWLFYGPEHHGIQKKKHPANPKIHQFFNTYRIWIYNSKSDRIL